MSGGRHLLGPLERDNEVSFNILIISLTICANYLSPELISAPLSCLRTITFHSYFSQCSHWLRTERLRGRSSGKVWNFNFSISSRLALGPTQPPIKWVPCALSLELSGKGPGADHSSGTSAEVKKMWFYTSTPPYAFMV
jgi:hypothetical protein